ncbi:Acid phosphatase/vanadium-dependent haloperoxidase-related protein [Senna tora]|uniref:Acid phosphatase/vanadium-dependent haloperoxidase-related protein n=1 Tax=Senna tora TaxID=362788 RepID=A0A834TRP9_9FABA|nr:Acid phosphatase/vanadium-dependent haloperoxidase-related protein [Senna tora]
MESVSSVTPKFKIYCHNNKPLLATNLSLFHLSHFKKHRAFFVSSSHRIPSTPQNLNPTWVSFPLLKTIQKLATSQTQKWVSSLRAYSDIQKLVDECNGCYLQNGGLGVALLSITTNAKHRISPFVCTLAANPTFVSGLLAWIVAQSLKVVINFFLERKWDLRLLCASGGMPSSHTALCTALTTSVAFCHGVADSLFPVCLGFSLIVMYDAIGVRRHAGMQAESLKTSGTSLILACHRSSFEISKNALQEKPKVLNLIVADLFQGHPISERKLKELLGHTPSQVFGGALIGIIAACFCCQSCIVPT